MSITLNYKADEKKRLLLAYGIAILITSAISAFAYWSYFQSLFKAHRIDYSRLYLYQMDYMTHFAQVMLLLVPSACVYHLLLFFLFKKANIFIKGLLFIGSALLFVALALTLYYGSVSFRNQIPGDTIIGLATLFIFPVVLAFSKQIVKWLI
jgi:hypothetical protein